MIKILNESKKEIKKRISKKMYKEYMQELITKYEKYKEETEKKIAHQYQKIDEILENEKMNELKTHLVALQFLEAKKKKFDEKIILLKKKLKNEEKLTKEELKKVNKEIKEYDEKLKYKKAEQIKKAKNKAKKIKGSVISERMD